MSNLSKQRREPRAAVSATLAARTAAFILDWAVGLGAAMVLGVAAWGLWLGASHGGTRQPSDLAIYAGLVVLSLTVPVWAAATVICIAVWGQTPGLAAMALRVADPAGLPPHPLRALVRVAVLAIGAVPTVLAPFLIVGLASAAVQGTLPPLVGAALAAPLLLPIAELASCILTRERRALHDLAAGTRVLRVDQPPRQPVA